MAKTRIVFSIATWLALMLPAPAWATETADRLSGGTALVWGRDGDGNATTFRVQAGGQLHASAGISIATSTGVRRWSEREVRVPTGLQCESLGETGTADPGTGTRVTLVPIAKGAPLVVAAPDFAAGLEANLYTESVVLTASLGPYLFVHKTVFGYSCGAHGGESHEFFVYDAETGRTATLYDDDAQRTLSSRLGPSALRALETQQTLFSSSVTETAFWPVFESNAVTMSHQFTGSTCYACGDGQWDSYTASTQVITPELPHELQRYTRAATVAVATVRRVHPWLTVGGVSFPEL